VDAPNGASTKVSDLQPSYGTATSRGWALAAEEAKKGQKDDDSTKHTVTASQTPLKYLDTLLDF
jgi:hypothetical protein